MTDQKTTFVDIWKSRPHLCGVCGDRLANNPNVWYFAHILPKGHYKAFKCRPKNISLLCEDCHYELDHITHRAKEKEEFAWIFLKQRLLKRQYHWYMANKLIVDSRLEAWGTSEQ